MNETPRLEESALLAIYAGDEDEARRIIAELSPRELIVLQIVSGRLCFLCGLAMSAPAGEK